MDLPQRKPNRLREYDYSQAGAYFITICVEKRKNLLSSIAAVGEGLAPPVIRLTEYGKIAEEQLFLLETRFPSVKIDRYVIMPNHIHILLRLVGDVETGGARTGGASPSPTISTVIGAYKSLTTRLCRIPKLFQRSFYDHVIRSDADYREIWEYIDNNPQKWALDRFYTE